MKLKIDTYPIFIEIGMGLVVSQRGTSRFNKIRKNPTTNAALIAYALLQNGAIGHLEYRKMAFKDIFHLKVKKRIRDI